ncbi:hypothetical protein GOSPT_062_00070 [Gordonia sputi NBRC 100414]|uniref:Uncharacterized protein n=1 Tax=Gordonia sputi NBRC 100414 TaxID=1089453 RepID=H5U0S5_9ACTN|nr:hypothetical protein A5777_23670 [Gordonia sp. 852002-10350_SCH5691597]GAB39272.1 hypothetical protein GOSPT_062_00070 [Gordonia sputi NBRC 100414]
MTFCDCCGNYLTAGTRRALATHPSVPQWIHQHREIPRDACRFRPTIRRTEPDQLLTILDTIQAPRMSRTPFPPG